MYEQYTDKQIVEMLMPKLAKPGWGSVDSNDLYPDTIEMIATIYRSAYIRGQLGRSFIIGEPKRTETKQTEHWVPANTSNIKVGSQVRVRDEAVHQSNPDCYPNVCVVGKVIDNSICKILPLIQWPKNSVGGDGVRRCLSRYLEVLLCE